MSSPVAFAFLQTRRSVPAKIMGMPVPDRAALHTILEAALRVPDHGKLQPWRLIVLEQAALRRLAGVVATRAQALGYDAEQTAKGQGQFLTGNLAVAVVGSPKASDKIPALEQTMSAAALCFGLVNAASAAGWGANWLSGWPSHDTGFGPAALDLAPGEWIAGFVHIGTPPATLPPDRPRPDVDAVTRWVSE